MPIFYLSHRHRRIAKFLKIYWAENTAPQHSGSQILFKLTFWFNKLKAPSFSVIISLNYKSWIDAHISQQQPSTRSGRHPTKLFILLLWWHIIAHLSIRFGFSPALTLTQFHLHNSFCVTPSTARWPTTDRHHRICSLFLLRFLFLFTRFVLVLGWLQWVKRAYHGQSRTRKFSQTNNIHPIQLVRAHCIDSLFVAPSATPWYFII